MSYLDLPREKWLEYEREHLAFCRQNKIDIFDARHIFFPGGGREDYDFLQDQLGELIGQGDA